ncbi:receptor-type tyrosine-protein phosphatase F-like [Branchiostoma floridae]|uniref:protein-tyrosine-phosphatase n=1 Tax=Branchiostoma floridae TaxID=7739 RepID=A0A9J7NCP7_BRAFL|nr:receptor-type tyrosine-protein phosphatase F-like [Branchiostoma floridae]
MWGLPLFQSRFFHMLGLLLCLLIVTTGANTSLSLFDFYDEKGLDGYNDERIAGISKEDCATRCLTGTSTVAFGSCLSFDYDNNGGGACILSTANKDTPGAVLSDSNPSTRFDYYHRKGGSMFEKHDNQALSGFNNQDVGGISPGECALRCLQGTSTVPAGTCRSFDYDRRRTLCILSTDSKDTQPSALGSNNNNDYYHRKHPCSDSACKNGGTCTYNNYDSFSCACTAGWTGDTCETVSVPPEVTQHPQNQTKTLEQAATFTCVIRGDPAPTVTWYQDGTEISSGGRFNIVETTDSVQNTVTSTLTISLVQRSDNGQYMCRGTSTAGTDSSETARLIVQERPDDISVEVTPLTITALRVTWTVRVTGNLHINQSEVSYRWSQDEPWSEAVVITHQSVGGTTGMEYTLEGLSPSTQYTVQVRVKNSLGWSDPAYGTGTTLDAPPGPPSSLRQTAVTHESLTLTWQAPSQPGVITGYTIQYGLTSDCTEAQLTQTVNSTGAGTSYDIQNLTYYTVYTFRVRGHTNGGAGDYSDCITARTAEFYPTKPLSVQFSDANSCNCDASGQNRTIALQVRWTRPQSVNGELWGYTLRLHHDNQVIYVTNTSAAFQGNQLEYVISGDDVGELQPVQNYSITVSAFNNVYRGANSDQVQAQSSDGCPSAPSITSHTQDGMCGIDWTPPSMSTGDITGYLVTTTATQLNSQSVSAAEADPVGSTHVQNLTWTSSLDVFPPYSLIHVTVRAKTCAAGASSEERTCRVERVEPPASIPVVNTVDPSATSTSFTMTLPDISSRNGPISCYHVIVVPMEGGESLAQLSTRMGAPDVILTPNALPPGRTTPYIALAFSGNSYVSGDVTIGSGDECTDPCCQVGAVEGAQQPGNRQLSPGSAYTATVRAYVGAGNRRKRATSQAQKSSAYITPVTTSGISGNQEQGSPVGGIVGGIVAAVVIISAAVVGLVFYRRRQAAKENDLVPPPLPPRWHAGEEEEMGVVGPATLDDEAPVAKPKPLLSIKRRKFSSKKDLDFRQPIPIEKLEREFNRRHAHDDQLFTQEYQSLPAPFGRERAEAYYNQENASRNRFKNIIAYDNGLVTLTPIEGVPGSGYIHASYIDGYREERKYIAAQGPMDNTIDDFWRMIWETGSTAIVMVTNLEEKGKKKCSQYWPDSGEQLYAADSEDGGITVTLAETVPMVDYVTRVLLIRKSDMKSRKVSHFHFTGWPDFGLPRSPMGLLKFRKTVTSTLTADSRPIVVHCSAGVGRTGTFITIDAMLDMIKEEQKVDVFGFVSDMRQNRSNMVQTAAQYVFIFKALLEQHLYGDTETEVTNIHRYMQNLRTVDPETGKTGIEAEFQKLIRIPIDKANMRSGNLPENLSKNRVLQVLPYDTSRVILQPKLGVKGGDYINASFIDGYRQKDAYIATQGPLDRTVEDFWRMVWEWNSCSIVMITGLWEKSQYKCAMYWPDEGLQSYGDLTVTLEETTGFPEYTLRTFSLRSHKDDTNRTVQQFHFHGWPEVGIPDNAAGMIDLIGQVQKQQQHSGNGPITVHCSSGAGRTGAFCAISTVLERVKAEGVCDVFQVVKTLRLQRPHMVQTLEQYQFCYQAVVEYLDSFDHYANFR